MKNLRFIIKTAAGGVLLMTAMAVTSSLQGSSIPSEANDSAVEAKETVQSGDVEEKPIEQLDDQTAQQAVSLDDNQDDHELSEGGPGMGRGKGRGPGRGQGRGKGRGMGRGPGAMGGMRADMTTLHTMFANRDKIKRTVKMLPNGAEATTESDNKMIAALLQEHVPAMEGRVIENKPLPPMTFHPVFVELIKHAKDYTLEYKETKKGMKVTYRAEDPFVVMLVQEHAKLVSRFIKNGMKEIHTPYTLPKISGQSKVPVKATPDKTNKTNPSNHQ